MRISDWSSDVCSSDLAEKRHPHQKGDPHHYDGGSRSPRQVGQDRNLRQQPRRGCATRSEEHTSELQSLMRISYAVFCLKKKKKKPKSKNTIKRALQTHTLKRNNTVK